MRFFKWACILIPCLGYASEIPALVLPAGVGVNIHFVTGQERDLDLIKEAGFRFIRMDFGWTGTEPRQGEYNWSAYEELLRNLDRRGIRAVFILDYSHPLYEANVSSVNPINHKPDKTVASPQHPESIAAYARWAAAAAKHFQDRHVIWEIWNEPNIHFWAPKPDVEQYTALAVSACRAIREADPGATIVGPASSGFPWEFLESFFRSGVLEYLDGVTVHPYRDSKRSPETATGDYKKLRELVDRHAPKTKPGRIPLLSGEWGYTTPDRGLSLETQAAYAIRQQLVNLLNEVPLSIWYDWKNDGTNPKEREENFGTVMYDLRPKPAYVAIKTLTSELAGYRIETRISAENEKDYLLALVHPAGARKVAAWTMGEPHTVSIGRDLLGGTPGRAVSGSGQALTIQIEAGKVELSLTGLPQYVTVMP
jgi:polysaccharide biosynthesis protein PslG